MTDTAIRGKSDNEEVEIEGAEGTKTKSKADPKSNTRRRAREVGERKPIPAAPRFSLGIAEELPPRDSLMTDTVLAVYEEIGDDPVKWVPINLEDEELEIKSLQAGISTAARKLGQPIRTAIRVSSEGQQVLWVRPL